jgi:Tat protein translocase TatC
MKVSLIVGVIISGPWILYQLWLFIGAGLYSHERKYVYTYFPLSVGLFMGGAALCFFIVIPIVLQFLFGFNEWLHLRPEIKMSTWITFALMVSLMFGVSFQLPLVMLFLERISIVSVKLYREKRRHAILIIAFLSMILTPSDPVSMTLMMVPCAFVRVGDSALRPTEPARQKEPVRATGMTTGETWSERSCSRIRKNSVWPLLSTEEPHEFRCQPGYAPAEALPGPAGGPARSRRCRSAVAQKRLLRPGVTNE